MSMEALSATFSRMAAKYGIEPTAVQNIEEEKVRWYNETEGHLHEQDGYNCTLCKNKGFVARLSESGVEVHSVCRCQKIRSTLKRAQRSGLGNIITEYTFDKFTATDDWQKAVKGRAQAFCTDDAAKWFYIGGQVGAGKTHICTAIAAHYIKAGREVKYMLWSEEAKKLKAFVNDPAYGAMIAQYKTVDVLYIDDFLKVKNGENPTPADINLAFEIINHRLLDNEKVTIISSEKTLDELMDYDEATMSRIYQKTGQYKLNIGRDRARNYRLRGGDTL